MGKLKAAADYASLPIGGRAPRPASEPGPGPAGEGAASSPVQSRFDAAEAALATADIAKPSPHDASVRAKLKHKKVFGLGQLPAFIVAEFERLRLEAGMGKREFFYHLLRCQGADIPSYDQLDGRPL